MGGTDKHYHVKSEEIGRTTCRFRACRRRGSATLRLWPETNGRVACSGLHIQIITYRGCWMETNTGQYMLISQTNNQSSSQLYHRFLIFTNQHLSTNRPLRRRPRTSPRVQQLTCSLLESNTCNTLTVELPESRPQWSCLKISLQLLGLRIVSLPPQHLLRNPVQPATIRQGLQSLLTWRPSSMPNHMTSLQRQTLYH